MENRLWWPEMLMDEMMPSGREKPADWLAPDAAGITTIRWDDEPDANVAGTLSPGEVVKFHWYEGRGRATVTVMPDGTWSRGGGREAGTVDMFTGTVAPAPQDADIANASMFWLSGDPETGMDSLDEFASCYAEMQTIDAEGESVEVDMGFWSQGVAFNVSRRTARASIRWRRQMSQTDTVVAAVRDDLLRRSQLGIAKYGVTLDRTDLNLRDWLQHAYEETLDQANYLKRAIIELDRADGKQD